jgi:hypothetical protein
MDTLIPLVVSLTVAVIGLVFALFPRWIIQMVHRHASSYLKEDLSGDPTYIYMFRFFGIAAVLLGLYALWQVAGSM